MSFASRRLAITLTGGLTLGFLALFVMVGMTVWLGERANVSFAQTTRQRDLRVAAVELRDSLRTAESSQRGFLLTGNEIYLAPYDTAKTRAQQELADLIALSDEAAGGSPMLRPLQEAVREKIVEMDQSIALKSAGQDGGALAIVQTNRGKALMDEINVFLYGAILSADEEVATYSAEQRRNAFMLRWVSIISAVVIVLVVAAVALTVYRNRQEIARARDEVRAINLDLEDRVERRTADLNLARERAEVLLSEVNHRVANSLQLVAALVNMQHKAVRDDAAKDALTETQARIHAISLIHKSLYTSGDVRSVALNDYLRGMLDNLETAMRKDGHTASLKCELEPVSLPTDESVSLGVAVTELVTNAFKYAYPAGRPGEIRVTLKQLSPEKAELTVEDDGVGLSEKPHQAGTGVGAKIIGVMAAALKTQVEYISRQPGTLARLIFPIEALS
ncbi:MAG: CHASE3 domain-containing protein [Alphaproteobacteria bacterium]|nr:CHASE3 domain-containing protein [Alphaproteobacteria bacterium]